MVVGVPHLSISGSGAHGQSATEKAARRSSLKLGSLSWPDLACAPSIHLKEARPCSCRDTQLTTAPWAPPEGRFQTRAQTGSRSTQSSGENQQASGRLGQPELL